MLNRLSVSRKGEDASGLFRLFFTLCILLFHMKGFYANPYLGRLFKIPFVGDFMMNGSLVNQFFFTLSGYYLSRKYAGTGEKGCKPVNGRNFLMNHYLKLLKYSLLTLPLGIWFHIHYYKEPASLFNCVLDIFLLRTGYGIGSGNPYNQPLWFIDVLFLMYVFFAVCVIFVKKYSDLACLVVMLVSAAGIHGGIIISLPDTRVLYALFAFTYGMGMFCIEKMMKDNKRAYIISMITSVITVIAFINEVLHYPSYTEIYQAGDIWIVLQFFLWGPVVWMASHIDLKNHILKKISMASDRAAMSIYVWHYPMIYVTMVLLGKLGIISTGILFVLGQVLMITAFSVLSAYVLEPVYHWVSGRLPEKIFYESAG